MKDNSGKIILALLAGASAGVIAGILMAPEAGEATRGSLKKSASKLGQDLESRLQAGMEQLQALSTSAGALIGRKGGNGSDAGAGSTGGGSSASGMSFGSSTGGGTTSGGNDGSTGGSTSGGGGRKKSTGGDSKGSGGGSNATA